MRDKKNERYKKLKLEFKERRKKSEKRKEVLVNEERKERK